MKNNKNEKLFYFVDESGDPYFYDRFGKYIVGKEGCSKILLLGFIKTEKPNELRLKINEIRKEIEKDKYLEKIPSLKKSLQAFHAKDDCPEIREKVFKLIKNLPFKAEFIVARKKETIFTKRHNRKPNLFYDDMISKLFQNHLHNCEENIIYFAVRGNSARQLPLEDAISKAKLLFENRWQKKIENKINIFPQRPEGEPCLQIIDYMNWAVQRIFIKKEERYFEFIKEKISLLFDIYDFDKYPKNFYTKKNEFNINKISPL